MPADLGEPIASFGHEMSARGQAFDRDLRFKDTWGRDCAFVGVVTVRATILGQLRSGGFDLRLEAYNLSGFYSPSTGAGTGDSPSQKVGKGPFLRRPN